MSPRSSLGCEGPKEARAPLQVARWHCGASRCVWVLTRLVLQKGKGVKDWTACQMIFSSHRQSSTGSVVVTATCATSLLSQITSKTKTKDLAEHKDLRVKPLFFRRPSMASSCDSAESIGTSPPDSDLDDEQIRALLASPLYLQEREANAERSQVFDSTRENFKSSSSKDPISTARPVALFASKKQVESRRFFLKT